MSIVTLDETTIKEIAQELFHKVSRNFIVRINSITYCDERADVATLNNTALNIHLNNQTPDSFADEMENIRCSNGKITLESASLTNQGTSIFLTTLTKFPITEPIIVLHFNGRIFMFYKETQWNITPTKITITGKCSFHDCPLTEMMTRQHITCTIH